MRLLYTVLVFLATTALCSCTSESPEVKASLMLEKSRSHLNAGSYEAARDTILSMRKQYPTALESRAQGMLLLDSVELLAARDSMAYADGEEWKRLSVKVQFFERKLQKDIEKLVK